MWELIRYYFGMSYSTCSLIISFDSMKSPNSVSIGRLTGNKRIEMLWRFLWTHFIQCWRNAFKDMIYHNAVNDADPWMYWILSHVGFKTTWIPSSRHGTHISFGHRDMESSCPGNQMLFSPDVFSALGYAARIRIRVYHEMLHGRVFTVSEIGNRSKKRPFWSCHKR